ncbi:MAG: energy-coupling factor transporter transmembrane protein EcfT [Actinomycetes bacterium]|jgi:energy-coupling factor transporter transmembrane protein EcfT|nr:energy-coupling factor transporter transmembrane protein EcfT [Actinomycetes bacterium]
MNLRDIDTCATGGTGWLHRTPLAAKAGAWLVAIALALTLPANRTGLYALAALILVLTVIAITARLPWRLYATLLAWPLCFGCLFAITCDLDGAARWMLIARAVGVAQASLTVVLTTPWPRLAQVSARTLPRLLSDALIMSWRSFFLLNDRMTALLRALRLRGGLRWRRPLQALAATARAFGTLLLYAMDLADRDWDVLVLRGYDGKFRVGGVTVGVNGETPARPQPGMEETL